MDDKRLTYALLISFFLHCAIIAGLSFSRSKLLQEPVKPMEVTYTRVKSIVRKPQDPRYNLSKIVEKEKGRLKVKAFIKGAGKGFEALSQQKSSLPSFQERIKDTAKLGGNIKSDGRYLSKLPILKSEKKIDVPFLKSEKITNVKYISYNENIRQKIRQEAYKYADHPDFQSGEVYLTFILTADGMLKDVKIIEDKTRANPYLRNVGLKSVREANPFPAFPRDLNYPELTFNVVISFEVKE
ncbi:MAG: hypothetical protein HQL24_00650 [Candidatus Omnitrophica bacterium]|nr:hypothetical protein [Candidatus Omnitrophota bacterium]